MPLTSAPDTPTDGRAFFALPSTLTHKSDPALVACDAERFALLDAVVGALGTELRGQLDDLRRAPGGTGRAAMDRDLEIHRVSGRLGLLDRFGVDLCLGRMDFVDGSPSVWVGRVIAADQDAIIRAPARGTLVVDGGPGTGKTVVALHRAAYLLHADERISEHRGGVLFIGPHGPYLGYVADVLPNLGERGVQIATLADQVPQGADAVPEPDARVAALKHDARMASTVEPAVALYEEPPTEPLLVQTYWADVLISGADWADSFAAADPGTPHNEARDQVWEALLDLLMDRLTVEIETQEVSPADVRRELAADADLRRTFSRAWPVLEPDELVADLWSVPAYLRRCAPWLDADERALLGRAEGSAWTDADLPLLDAMAARLGDPRFAAHERQRAAEAERTRAEMDQVVDDLLSATQDPDSPLHLLRRQSIREDLTDDSAVLPLRLDRLAGPFAHVIVDEAQELTPAQWQMLTRRNPTRSSTVVGDRAQARHGFGEPWDERLAVVGLPAPRVATLTVNYRTPSEVMELAEPVIRGVLPDANVPTSVRSSGVPVRWIGLAQVSALVDEWSRRHEQGLVAVITDDDGALAATGLAVDEQPRLRALTPALSKGLEFDLVVLVDAPAEAHRPRDGAAVTAAVDRYVAMTRSTSELVLVGD